MYGGNTDNLYTSTAGLWADYNPLLGLSSSIILICTIRCNLSEANCSMSVLMRTKYNEATLLKKWHKGGTCTYYKWRVQTDIISIGKQVVLIY